MEKGRGSEEMQAGKKLTVKGPRSICSPLQQARGWQRPHLALQERRPLPPLTRRNRIRQPHPTAAHSFSGLVSTFASCLFPLYQGVAGRKGSRQGAMVKIEMPVAVTPGGGVGVPSVTVYPERLQPSWAQRESWAGSGGPCVAWRAARAGSETPLHHSPLH